MPLSDAAVRKLGIACGSVAKGREVAAIIDADGGTLDAGERLSLQQAVGDFFVGDALADSIDADTALTSIEINKLSIAMGDRYYGSEIATEQGS